jgi:hypothetical protein
MATKPDKANSILLEAVLNAYANRPGPGWVHFIALDHEGVDCVSGWAMNAFWSGKEIINWVQDATGRMVTGLWLEEANSNRSYRAVGGLVCNA